MCGIAGFFTVNNNRRIEEIITIANEMANTLNHRGPDNGDIWISEEVGLTLAHRRLSVIDLSITGNQPMYSENKQFVIVFNGEIYNHIELRQELLAYGKTFRGHSDTEVILAGFEKWGIEQTIRKCVGMFAIALWDIKGRDLYLIRDRMGEKPLYYGWQKKTFLFSSELKAIRKHPDFEDNVNLDSLTLYFRYKYIPAPYSIYKGIYKLEPGMILKLPLNKTLGMKSRTNFDKLKYWSLKEVVENGECNQFDGTTKDIVDILEALIIKSIEGQMISDVPLGAFLSGGIDSSTIVALMQKLSSKPVNTFCIGFEARKCNEAIYAKEIATHLGCQHTELYVTPNHTLEVIPRMPQLYDEPFADSSQIPTYLVSQLARKHVTVCLSGDAGDELFYGYKVYALLFKRWNIARRINVSNELLQNIILKLTQLACKASKKKLAVVKSLLSSVNYIDVYKAMISVFHNPSELVLDSNEPPSIYSNNELLPNISCKENAIMALDALQYLPDDILVKVDRAAMACSLETRIPLLDHRIVEFAFKIPFNIKFREGKTKWPIRQILYKYVPNSLIERPKKGFSLPLDKWLRNELRAWVCDLLNSDQIRKEGILNDDVVHKYLNEHMAKQHDHSEILWSMLMLQCWLHNK
jgi:asparagine synthase (glutamine-hydrolysing)